MTENDLSNKFNSKKNIGDPHLFYRFKTFVQECVKIYKNMTVPERK